MNLKRNQVTASIIAATLFLTSQIGGYIYIAERRDTGPNTHTTQWR